MQSLFDTKRIHLGLNDSGKSIFLISSALTVIVLNVLKTPSPTTSASTENVTSKLLLCQIFKDLLLKLKVKNGSEAIPFLIS